MSELMEDGDLEDGELSGSDTDIGTTARTRAEAPSGFGGQSFNSRAAMQSSVSGYRSSGKCGESSDSDQESSEDEEAAVWRRKRQKVSSAPPQRVSSAPPQGAPGAPGAPAGRRVNNIWGSVVQEQCQDAVAAELGFFGMEGDVSMSSRSVETYNFVLARKMMEKEREMERQKQGEEVNMLDAQLDDYMRGRGLDEGGGAADAKRKRSAKQRLGPRAEMDVKGRYEITDADPEEKVVDEIAYRLQEPKKELLERVVRVVGAKKAIELLMETATLEENGGVYTIDGSRRRTPGGVYLNLLKNTPSISKAQVRQIFLEEQQKECKSKKAAQKRRRHVLARKMKQAISTLNLQEHDDVSRETFASDTNEALESLEEQPHEEEQEEEEEVEVEVEEDDEEEAKGEAALGIEDTAVVYTSADLEVF